MELLQPLLDSLRKENQIRSPISSKLGEKVLKECVWPLDLSSRSSSIGPSAPVICETLLEDEMPLNNNGTSLKTLQHLSQMEPLKNTGFGTNMASRHRTKKKAVAQIRMLTWECWFQKASKRKPRQRSRKSRFVSKGDVDTTSGLNIVKREENPLMLEELSLQQVDEKKQKNDRATIEIHDIGKSGDEEIKISFGDENISRKPAETKRRRSFSMRKDEDSERHHFTKCYGEEVVGSRIRVWWPLDKTSTRSELFILDYLLLSLWFIIDLPARLLAGSLSS
ncbi:hypothetical protein HAX54_011264 [Datura stramonium]|uniref:Uncharacterized protein n=1 Tax=Datura stramonium TaxID=4076 RepID=A0ABS8TJF4_DATST|nr:hypothetical protein [Datura stramonium]